MTYILPPPVHTGAPALSKLTRSGCCLKEPRSSPLLQHSHLGSVSCQVAHALSSPSQAATLEVARGQVAGRANAHHVVLNRADLALTLKTKALV